MPRVAMIWLWKLAIVLASKSKLEQMVFHKICIMSSWSGRELGHFLSLGNVTYVSVLKHMMTIWHLKALNITVPCDRWFPSRGSSTEQLWCFICVNLSKLLKKQITLVMVWDIAADRKKLSANNDYQHRDVTWAPQCLRSSSIGVYHTKSFYSDIRRTLNLEHCKVSLLAKK